MKKIIGLLITTALIISLFPALTAVALDGAGTPDNPYRISSTADLNAVRDNLTAHYIQTADINFGIGEMFLPIGSLSEPFCGYFNGNGYKIDSLTIDIPYDEEEVIGEVGLFGSALGATIENVAIENITINVENLTFWVGGLVGQIDVGVIRNSSVTGEISVSHNIGGGEFGGLVGRSDKSSIFNSYSAVNISTDIDDAFIGGFIGYNDGYIENSYSVGTLTSPATDYYKGGFGGYALFDSLEHCYYDADICGLTDSMGLWRTTSDMMKQEIYELWDFNNVWKINEGVSYPTLRKTVNVIDVTVYNEILTIYFSEKLKYTILPQATNFTVYINNEIVTVISTKLQENTLVLTLGTEAFSGDSVYFECDVTDCGLTDLLGNILTALVMVREARNITYSENADLKSLTLSATELNEQFVPTITKYTASVENDVDEITITPETDDSEAYWVLLNGLDEILENATVNLRQGVNTFKIRVDSVTGTAQKIYTVEITRRKAIVLANESELTFEYMKLLDEPEPIILNVTSDIKDLKYQVGKTDDWIEAAPDMDFTDGYIEVCVDVRWLETKTYEGGIWIYGTNFDTINVPITLIIRDCDITEFEYLTVENVELTQDGDIYSGKVDKNTEYADITASALYNGIVGGAGQYALNYGNNRIPITILADDGETEKTFYIDIYRNYPATLDSLTLAGGTVSPLFDPNISEYIFNVTDKNDFSFTPIVNNSDNKIYYSGDVQCEYEEGHAGDPNHLTTVTYMGNSVVITVKNSLTNEETTYHVTIAGFNFLSPVLDGLTITGGTLAPEFSPATTDYTVAVADDSAFALTTTADTTLDMLFGGNVIDTSAQNVSVVKSDLNGNTLTVTVTNSDTKASITYTIALTGYNFTSAQINGLTIAGGILTPAFDPNITDYTITVTQPSELTITPSFVSGLQTTFGGSITGIVNNIVSYKNLTGNTVTITVVNPDTKETIIYTITLAGYDYTPKQPSNPISTNTTAGYRNGRMIYVSSEAMRELPYIHGYSDGTFRPETNITRAEISQILYNIYGNETDVNLNVLSIFPDGNEIAWAVNALAWNVSASYLKGDDLGNLLPNNAITRAELAVFIDRVASEKNLLKPSTTTNFTDVNEHWAEQAIYDLANGGVITGYPDGTFNPDANVTRAEAVAMFSRMLGRSITFDSGKIFTDVLPDYWAYTAIMNAACGVDS